MIPFLDLKAINQKHRKNLIDAATRVIDSGWYVLGKEVEFFEKEFAGYCGVSDCISVANGLDALVLTLRAWKELGRLDFTRLDRQLIMSKTEWRKRYEGNEISGRI